MRRMCSAALVFVGAYQGPAVVSACIRPYETHALKEALGTCLQSSSSHANASPASNSSLKGGGSHMPVEEPLPFPAPIREYTCHTQTHRHTDTQTQTHRQQTHKHRLENAHRHCVWANFSEFPRVDTRRGPSIVAAARPGNAPLLLPMV